MSANKHRTNQLHGLSLQHMQTILGPWKHCPKSSCKGTMTKVLVRYVDHGPIHNELECTTCGKVQKDPKFRDQRRRNFQRRGRKPYNKGKRNDSYSRQS